MQRAKQIIDSAEKNAKEVFLELEDISLFNQKKVLDAFRKNKIADRHFYPTTGYGYDDSQRSALGRVFADAFKAEKAIVSTHLASGTHTLTVTLFGLLKSGDSLLCISGKPYDTLNKVIYGEGIGSLKDYDISYDMLPLKTNNTFDREAIAKYLAKKQPTVIFITRSRGYSWREAFSVEQLRSIIAYLRKLAPKSIVFVDNCYGEFVEKEEPIEADADVIAGSLIKNPGGGLAPTGGYIAGKAHLIDRIANRLTAPSLGIEIGSYSASYLPLFQGFFVAPQTVEAALKTSVLAGYAFSSIGYEVSPVLATAPKDTIRAIKFDTRDELISFIQSIQYSSPVDSYVTPYPGEMPGYTRKVI
ncbi:MAG: aminotransferase class I/II-fold pyridoxal phosphate-dependent enzyme, partial [Clostridia bacterium]